MFQLNAALRKWAAALGFILIAKILFESSWTQACLYPKCLQMFRLHNRETAVRNGIILIYDMTNAKYANFDADLSKKLFNMLKVNFTHDYPLAFIL